MPITFRRAYISGDRVYASLQEAQRAELQELFSRVSDTSVPAENIARLVMDNMQLVIDILTTTDQNRPKARAINGGTKKKRKAKINAEQLPLPIGAA